MSLSKLFDITYLFDPTPGANFAYLWWFVGFWVTIFLISLVCFALSYNNKYDRVYKKLFKKWSSFLLYWSLIGILFTWLRDQNIPYIGMRVIVIFYTLLFIGISLTKILCDKKITPKTRIRHKEMLEKSKYLPKRRK